MKIEEKFEHILKNSIHIQDPDNVNIIGWFYPSESELRHKKLCELMNRKYEVNLNNHELLIKQDIKNDTFWIHNYKIWSVLYNEKGWNYDAVQVFTKERLEQHLKRKGITTIASFKSSLILLEQHLKRKGITTGKRLFHSTCKQLEQHLKRKGVTISVLRIYRQLALKKKNKQ